MNGAHILFFYLPAGLATWFLYVRAVRRGK